MIGFAYAVVGMKAGRPMQWSHMTGVLPEYRGGLGYRLKLEQRARALAQGYDLIEWTFDPMQAMNAHFNFAKLGVRGRGVRGERLRRIDQHAAPRDADRSAGRVSGTSPSRTWCGGSSSRRSCGCGRTRSARRRW